MNPSIICYVSKVTILLDAKFEGVSAINLLPQIEHPICHLPKPRSIPWVNSRTHTDTQIHANARNHRSVARLARGSVAKHTLTQVDATKDQWHGSIAEHTLTRVEATTNTRKHTQMDNTTNQWHKSIAEQTLTRVDANTDSQTTHECTQPWISEMGPLLNTHDTKRCNHKHGNTRKPGLDQPIG